MKDDMVGEELLADYMLFTLNKHRSFLYALAWCILRRF